MKCPSCGARNDEVVKSRPADDGLHIRRLRICLSCRRRFTTHEDIEAAPPSTGRPRRDDTDRTNPAVLRAHDLPRRLQVLTKGSL